MYSTWLGGRGSVILTTYICSIPSYIVFDIQIAWSMKLQIPINGSRRIFLNFANMHKWTSFLYLVAFGDADTILHDSIFEKWFTIA